MPTPQTLGPSVSQSIQRDTMGRGVARTSLTLVLIHNHARFFSSCLPSLPCCGSWSQGELAKGLGEILNLRRLETRFPQHDFQKCCCAFGARHPKMCQLYSPWGYANCGWLVRDRPPCFLLASINLLCLRYVKKRAKTAHLVFSIYQEIFTRKCLVSSEKRLL